MCILRVFGEAARIPKESIRRQNGATLTRSRGLSFSLVETTSAIPLCVLYPRRNQLGLPDGADEGFPIYRHRGVARPPARMPDKIPRGQAGPPARPGGIARCASRDSRQSFEKARDWRPLGAIRAAYQVAPAEIRTGATHRGAPRLPAFAESRFNASIGIDRGRFATVRIPRRVTSLRACAGRGSMGDVWRYRLLPIPGRADPPSSSSARRVVPILIVRGYTIGSPRRSFTWASPYPPSPPPDSVRDLPGNSGYPQGPKADSATRPPAPKTTWYIFAYFTTPLLPSGPNG